MASVVEKVLDKTFTSYAEDNITDDLDLAVVGNSIRADNPEVKALREKGIPFVSLPEAISYFLIGSREECPASVVFSGTHGKTTTTAAAAFVLEKAGRKPGYFIGGVVDGLESQVRPWSTETPYENRVVVLEGDEYDSAFFEKWSKFHAYRPDILVITSLEFDEETDKFQLLSRTPVEDGSGQKLEISLGKESSLSFKSRLLGEHNALNFLAVSAVGQELGLSEKNIALSLAEFEGVRRRQQVLVNKPEVKLIEDFAHHPTAVRLTLQGLREAHPDWNLIAVFEPRSNTSRRAVFQELYAESFRPADKVFIKAPPEREFYSKEKSESDDSLNRELEVKSLVAGIEKRGTSAVSFEESTWIVDSLPDSLTGKDLVVLMSNGSFDGIPASLKNLLT